VRKRAIACARRVWDKVILAPLRAGELVEIRRCLTTAPLDTNLREQRRISTISRKRICLFPGVSEHRRTTANLSRRPRMADDTSSSLVGSTSFFLLFAGKKPERKLQKPNTACGVCSNAARAAARTRLLHWPPSRTSSSRLPWARGSNALGSAGRNLPIN